MDINLNTLKREIEEYLERAGLAVFRSTPGAMEGLELVLWDAEQYPDYQMFLETARKAGATMVIFATREFETEDIDELQEQIEESEMERDEQREIERRLRELRAYVGVTCSLELAFDHENRMFVYEVRPDWYDEFLGIEEDVMSHMPAEEDIGGDSLGGYFSRN
ncbi:MAG TPA: hypothetical protein VN442_01410 [Bryobacteraceae bacterium]|nr:hypothetical protein [Bryobacteraceae bacterium]